MLAPWKNRSNGTYRFVSLVDGGYLDSKLCKRLRWLVPSSSKMWLKALLKRRRGFLVAVNSFISSLRGPLAKSQFADQVHHLIALKKAMAVRYRATRHCIWTCWSPAQHLEETASGRSSYFLLRSDLPFCFAFFCYHPTVFDDYVLKDRFNDEPCMNDLIFEFRGEEDIPCSLRGIFLHAEDYTAALIASPHNISANL
jgi:hypothetical protein